MSLPETTWINPRVSKYANQKTKNIQIFMDSSENVTKNEIDTKLMMLKEELEDEDCVLVTKI